MNQHLKSTIWAALTFVSGTLLDYITSNAGETITVKGMLIAAGAGVLVWLRGYSKTETKTETTTVTKTEEKNPIQ